MYLADPSATAPVFKVYYYNETQYVVEFKFAKHALLVLFIRVHQVLQPTRREIVEAVIPNSFYDPLTP